MEVLRSLGSLESGQDPGSVAMREHASAIGMELYQARNLLDFRCAGISRGAIAHAALDLVSDGIAFQVAKGSKFGSNLTDLSFPE
jgi:hypothetical protein